MRAGSFGSLKVVKVNKPLIQATWIKVLPRMTQHQVKRTTRQLIHLAIVRGLLEVSERVTPQKLKGPIMTASGRNRRMSSTVKAKETRGTKHHHTTGRANLVYLLPKTSRIFFHCLSSQDTEVPGMSPGVPGTARILGQRRRKSGDHCKGGVIEKLGRPKRKQTSVSKAAHGNVTTALQGGLRKRMEQKSRDTVPKTKLSKSGSL